MKKDEREKFIKTKFKDPSKEAKDPHTASLFKKKDPRTDLSEFKFRLRSFTRVSQCVWTGYRLLDHKKNVQVELVMMLEKEHKRAAIIRFYRKHMPGEVPTTATECARYLTCRYRGEEIPTMLREFERKRYFGESKTYDEKLKAWGEFTHSEGLNHCKMMDIYVPIDVMQIILSFLGCNTETISLATINMFFYFAIPLFWDAPIYLRPNMTHHIPTLFMERSKKVMIYAGTISRLNFHLDKFYTESESFINPQDFGTFFKRMKPNKIRELSIKNRSSYNALMTFDNTDVITLRNFNKFKFHNLKKFTICGDIRISPRIKKELKIFLTKNAPNIENIITRRLDSETYSYMAQFCEKLKTIRVLEDCQIRGWIDFELEYSKKKKLIQKLPNFKEEKKCKVYHLPDFREFSKCLGSVEVIDAYDYKCLGNILNNCPKLHTINFRSKILEEIGKMRFWRVENDFHKKVRTLKIDFYHIPKPLEEFHFWKMILEFKLVETLEINCRKGNGSNTYEWFGVDTKQYLPKMKSLKHFKIVFLHTENLIIMGKRTERQTLYESLLQTKKVPKITIVEENFRENMMLKIRTNKRCSEAIVYIDKNEYDIQPWGKFREDKKNIVLGNIITQKWLVSYAIRALLEGKLYNTVILRYLYKSVRWSGVKYDWLKDCGYMQRCYTEGRKEFGEDQYQVMEFNSIRKREGEN